MILDLVKLTEDTSAKLFEMHCRPFSRLQGLIYPSYSPLASPGYVRKQRLSEQETRLAYILCLEQFFLTQNRSQQDFLLEYSIETPTVMSFTGFSPNQIPKVLPRKHESALSGKGGSSSGKVDLSLYIPPTKNPCNLNIRDISLSGEIETAVAFESDLGDCYLPAVNIEFKHGTSSPLSIRKDVLKLMCEPAVGVFVHSYISNPPGKSGQSSFQAIESKYREARDFAVEAIHEFHMTGTNYYYDPQKEIYVFLIGLDPQKQSYPLVECRKLSTWQIV